MKGREMDERQGLRNPLLIGMCRVERYVEKLKAGVRDYYYAVMLAVHSCPECGGSLRMAGPSKCRCGCGRELDPTEEFQKSECCGARLERKILHYVCSQCKRVAPSKFLFDERLFDAAYFSQRMKESRERKRRKREEIRGLLAESRSRILYPAELPELGSKPGFESDLNAFIGAMPQMAASVFLESRVFRLEEYRRAILESVPPGCLIRFSALPPVQDNMRLDRVRRFMTLLFMEQERELELTQLENDIQVEVYETD